jgi:hypothetical protein
MPKVTVQQAIATSQPQNVLFASFLYGLCLKEVNKNICSKTWINKVFKGGNE